MEMVANGYAYTDTWTPGYPAPEYVTGYEIPGETCANISLPVLTSLSMAEMGKQCASQWYHHQQYSQDDMVHANMRRDAYIYQHQAYHKYHASHAQHQHAIHSHTIARRNERERNRVKSINSTFANLRQHLPSSSKSKKLSKVQILRSAIQYIGQLQHILDTQEREQTEDGPELKLDPAQLKIEPDSDAASQSSRDSNKAFDSESVVSDCEMANVEFRRTSIVSPTSFVSESSSRLSSFGDDGDEQSLIDELSDWMK